MFHLGKDLGRQTDGSVRVASNSAVLDRDPHGASWWDVLEWMLAKAQRYRVGAARTSSKPGTLLGMRRRAAWLLLLLPLAVPLTAFALASLTVSPTSATFETRCVRTSATSKLFTVKNASSPEASDVRVIVSPSTVASIFPLSGATAAASLGPNATMTFKAGFKPQRAGTTSGSAVIFYTTVEPEPSNTNKPSPTPTTRTTTVALSGSAVDRFVDVAPRALNLGTSRVGRAVPRQRVTIYDDGASALTVTSISLAGRHPGDFSISSTGRATVTESRPFVISVGFTPRGVGGRSAELVIRSNSCEEPVVRVAMAGIGVEPDIAVLPSAVDLGLVRLGEYATTDVSVIDQGQAPLRVSSIKLTGADADAFKLSNVGSLPKTLGAGRSLIFTLRFDAKEPGKRQTRIRIASNDPDRPVTSIKVLAEGGEPPPSPTPTLSVAVVPTAAPPPPTRFRPELGAYAAELLVAASVLGFFLALVMLRRVRGIPE